MPSPYETAVLQAARQAGLDPDFVMRLVQQESGWNPSARSPKGALGLMQLMPETAADYGVTDLLNPLENIKAGIAHLTRLNKKYSGAPDRVAAAYNFGEGNLDSGRALPSETVNYVRNVAGVNAPVNGPVGTDGDTVPKAESFDTAPEGAEFVGTDAAPDDAVFVGTDSKVGPDTVAPDGAQFVGTAKDDKEKAREDKYKAANPGLWARIVNAATHPLETAAAWNDADRVGRAAVNAVVGFGKGALGTAADIGEGAVGLLEKGGLVSKEYADTTRAGAARARELATPQGGAQQIGRSVEQVAEFAVPAAKVDKVVKGATAGARLGTRIAARAAGGGGVGAGVAAVHGENPLVGGLAGAAGGALAVPAEAVAPYLASGAVSLMRGAIKPTKTAIKSMPALVPGGPAGVGAGLDKQAEKLATYLLEHRLSPNNVRSFVSQFEQRLEDAISQEGGMTVQALDKVRNALKRVSDRYGEAPIGKEIESILDKLHTMVPGPPVPKPILGAGGKPLLDASGKPMVMMVPGPPTSVPRLDVTAGEALRLAQNMPWVRSMFGTVGRPGIEAAKAVNSGLREAARESSKIAAAQEGHGMARAAEKALDHAAHRIGNREAFDPFAVVAASKLSPHSWALAAIKQYMHKHPIEAAHYAKELSEGMTARNLPKIQKVLQALITGLAAEREE